MKHPVPRMLGMLLGGLAVALPLAAQQANIQGVVRTDAGRPVAAAEARIEGTALVALTDSAGFYRLRSVPPGPQILLVRRIGFAPTRLPITVPTSGTLTVDATLAASALSLPDIIVTADPISRAAGELATASVIDREAIAAQNAVGIRGVLELLPGVPMSPPGIDGPQQFALRNVPSSGSTQLTNGGPGASDLAAFGTQIVVDGVPMSNNANLQTTGPRGEVNVPSTAGGGIDLRTIPAATLERIEAIRGVPSARFGDLTQGVILVETRAGVVPPTLNARYDPRTFSLNAIAGRGFGTRHTVTGHLDVTETRTAPGVRNDLSRRFTGQLAHRATPGRWTLDSRLDLFRVLQDSPERPEVVEGRASRADDRGVRVSHRGRRPVGQQATFELTASVNHVRRDARSQSLLIRSALPFTDRLEPGTSVGKYIGGEYLAAVDLDGSEWHVYTRAELDQSFDALGFTNRTRSGLELRREWNGGPGYQFDIEFPPQTTFNGVQGFDRPRRFDDVPPIASTALYVDHRARAGLAGMALDVQAGMRLDLLHRGTAWFSAPRDQVVQPRVQAELAPAGWFRLRGGWGRTAKMPPLSALYPAPQYFDVVNVNWFTNDPAARLAVLSTFVDDPTNPDLGFAVGTKSEVGVELASGRRGTALAVTVYRDRTRGSAGLNP
ncbi:MAG: TonB-dependent receptor, partial [Gemmatimonadales bacterium]